MPRRRAPEYRLTRSPSVAVANVVDPTFDRFVELGKSDSALPPGVVTLAKAPGGMPRLPGFQLAVVGVDDKAQPGSAALDGRHLTAPLMQHEPQSSEELDDGRPPLLWFRLGVSNKRISSTYYPNMG